MILLDVSFPQYSSKYLKTVSNENIILFVELFHIQT